MSSDFQPQVVRSNPPENAFVTMPDGTVWRARVGTPVEAYFKAASPIYIPMLRRPGDDDSKTLVAAVVDGELRELTYPATRDVRVKPVFLHSGDGLRIYRRALSLLMLVAADELYPDRKIKIDHSLPFGGYYCTVTEGLPFTAAEIDKIKTRMQEIVLADQPIKKKAVPLAEAIRLFEERNDQEKLRLMAYRQKNYLILYELRGLSDYFYGYMVPSTGYLYIFDLTCDPDGQGFILHYPRRHAPTEIQPVLALPKLRQIFSESARWLDLLGIQDIGMLNEAIEQGRARELILVAEALHESSYADVADMVVARQPDVRLVLIGGPSSAGKTTSSKRLAIQLLAHGLRPFTLEMDNYFVDRDKTPLNEMGEYDFEHLEAVDLDLFNDHLLRLMAGEEVRLTRFNFFTGKRELADTAVLTSEHVIIVEGIHGLNPELVRAISPARYFRMYISCLTQLNIDRHNRIPTTDVRLLRRIVRDAAYRGYSAQDTLELWGRVREGERRWIFPFQEFADVQFNSALVYELPVLRKLAFPLLLQVDPGSSHHIEAKRLLAFLQWVKGIDAGDLVPDNSILREFIGGGILRNYVPGKPDVPLSGAPLH